MTIIIGHGSCERVTVGAGELVSYQNPLQSQSVNYPLPFPVDLYQAKFPVEGSPSLLPGTAFFCPENISLPVCLAQFVLFLKR
jgi:hypothetical protein